MKSSVNNLSTQRNELRDSIRPLKRHYVRMKLLKLMSVAMLSATVLLTSCDKDNDYNDNPPPKGPESTVVSASGDLTTALTQFRSLLGDSLNNSPGKTSGRREVNWDGVPAALTNNDNFPFDFFNATDPAIGNGRKRGLVYKNTGTSFRVDSSAFADIDPSYAGQFKPFSGKRLFTYIGNNVTEVSFKVPGTNTDAFVKGFGLVFSDVDDANSTTLEFFNGNKSLGMFKAPARNDANGFSFLGVFFPEEKVTRIKITAGNAVLAAGVKDISDSGSKDLVVMDDFFYTEPLPIN